MKKKHLLMLIVLLFSFIAQTLPSLITAHAKTMKTEVIDEKFLKVFYDYEIKEDVIRWEIMFSRQSKESDKEHRLKLKVTNEKGKVIDYPTVKDMQEKDGWLIEKDFSSSFEGQLVLDLPKADKKIQLSVQMDERFLSGEQSVQENILTNQETFTLAIKTNSEELIKPTDSEVKEPIPVNLSPTDGLLEPYSKRNVNKDPSYTSDSKGTYPSYSWTPTEQFNVMNHQGGYEGENTWDGLTNWAITPDNYTNSYITYGENEANPNIALRKYASETAKADEFNIRLNVRGNTISTPGIDIVFVLDNTASMIETNGNISGMTRKSLAVNSLQRLIDKFEAAEPDPNSLRIGGVIYSDYNNPNGNPTVAMTNNHAGWQNIVDTYKNTRSDGDTYTQKALMDAQQMLKDVGGVNRRKVIFLLTDGAPNISVVPIDLINDSSIYYDGVRFTQYDSNSLERGSYMQAASSGGRNYTVKIPEGYQIVRAGRSIYSHLTPVNSTAADIKEQEIEINSIAINIKKDHDYEDHTTDELIRGLYQVASKKANATGEQQNDYQFYHANTAGDFDISFEDWFTSVIQTIDKGKIEDPIGDMFELVGQPEVKEVRKTGVPAIEAGKMPTLDMSDSRKVEVNNINLYRNQEIQVDYKVRLKTEDPTYEADKWYPTNGKTTLTPTPERTTDKLDFGVPSARGKADKIKIPVEKVWSDSFRGIENYWNLRQMNVRVDLQRKNGSSWETIEQKILTPTKAWRDIFSAVEGGSNVYRVVEEARVASYDKPTYNYSEEFTAANIPSDGVKINNTLLTGTITFYKYKDDGKTAFTSSELPKFTVRRKSDNKLLVADLTPNASGAVTIRDIPLGDFIVEESHVPQGYEKMADMDLKAAENTTGTGLNITLNGQASPKVTNKLKDFTLKVKIVDQNGHESQGASFRLVGASYDLRRTTGPNFEFTGLSPGEYSLSETITPSGYQGMSGTVKISISQTGVVTIQSNPNVSGSTSLGDTNLIQLIVTNKKNESGLLPATGGPGTALFSKLAFGVILIAGILLSLSIWLHTKWRGS